MILVSGPVSEPITLSEAKAHCRIEDSNTSEDAYLTSLITVARLEAESYTSNAIGEQTWSHTDWEFPTKLHKLPLVSVTSIQYWSGTQQTWDSSLYYVRTGRQNRIVPVNSYPSIDNRPDAVTTTFLAGEDANEDTKHALKIMVLHWWQNRELAVFGNMSMVPSSAYVLLDRLKGGIYV